jgi:hypothetical protein
VAEFCTAALKWVAAIGLRSEEYGTHSLRRTKASMIYKATGNIRAIQILLGHSKIENTVRYLGVDIPTRYERFYGITIVSYMVGLSVLSVAIAIGIAIIRQRDRMR